MHSTLLLPVWAFVSYIIYLIASSVLTSRHHRRRAHELHCADPPRVRTADPIGIINIRAMLKADKESRMPQYLCERYEASCEREGKRLGTFCQNILGSWSVFTTEPENIKAILASQFKEFGLGDTRNNNFAPLLGHGIFSTDGKGWEHSRTLLRPQFAREQVSDLDLEERHVQNLLRNLPVQSDGWTEVTDLKTLFFRLTIDSASEFLFGESLDSQISHFPDYKTNRMPMKVSEKEFGIAFDGAQGGIAKAARFGDMYWMAHDKQLKKHCETCHTFIDHYVQLALSKDKASLRSDPKNGQYVFLDAVAETTRDPVELRQHLLSIMVAGRDTTASLLSIMFLLLTKNPHIYAQLRSVVLETFGTFDNPKNITFSSLKNCTYLQWCMNETLRLYPQVPINSRRALVDTTLPTGGGPSGTSPIYIRKGQQCDYSVFVMQRRKDLWGPDADEWKPERWDGRKSGWEFLPFNGGPRICIGQQFALTEAGYVAVRLMQKFGEIQAAPGDDSWGVDKNGAIDGKLKVWVTLTGSPADGVRVRMKGATE
ncbi:cytochrome P450 [Amniculicola lignicola CBS 123094]|uniref:Cytochrome P450 n=1 Tax=Amniculicola lignicola CBS 123094 TaxID=1392246 RepID=A0A6A5WGX2_9PLEO|nr:cytochrome P450 [Amniculicola lignicola CBS 123094]